ncbi:MAG: DUF4143 domain-containing protein [Bacteroidales bacterium]
MYSRIQTFSGSGQESLFLWGARQTGKSTLLKTGYPRSPYFDLLLGEEYLRFQQQPGLLREIITALDPAEPVIIDEIQRLPHLLNEVQWLMVNKGYRFILSGSSPRKIIRTGANLLGGRALRYELYPLVYPEITDFNLLRALNHGLLPRHYLSAQPHRLLAAYIGNYLKDEIIHEANIRNIGSFSRFLEAASFSNGEMVTYSNIATDCGVSAPTVREYFQILEDTLTARFLPSFQKKPKRRVIQAPKFYFFDLGIPNFLLKRNHLQWGSESIGKAFEHFIYQELIAHSHYSGLNYPIYYWRTASQIEVDFILGEGETAIEVKSTTEANNRHTKGLKYFSEEYPSAQLLLVCNEKHPRQAGNITILPWQLFLEKLWTGKLIR